MLAHMDLRTTCGPVLSPSVARAALALSEHMIVVTDPSGRIVYVNPRFTEVTGYEPHEAVGGTPRLLRSGVQDQGFYRALWDTITAGRAWTGELVNRRKDGRLYTDRMTITPLRSPTGAITHFVAVKRDVTGHLADLTAGSPTGLAHVDGTGRLVYANDRLCSLLGAPFEDLLGARWLARLDQGSEPLVAALAEVASGGRDRVCAVTTAAPKVLRVHLAPCRSTRPGPPASSRRSRT
jgi:PAS domain S-box-containing protein